MNIYTLISYFHQILIFWLFLIVFKDVFKKIYETSPLFLKFFVYISLILVFLLPQNELLCIWCLWLTVMSLYSHKVGMYPRSYLWLFYTLSPSMHMAHSSIYKSAVHILVFHSTLYLCSYRSSSFISSCVYCLVEWIHILVAKYFCFFFSCSQREPYNHAHGITAPINKIRKWKWMDSLNVKLCHISTVQALRETIKETSKQYIQLLWEMFSFFWLRKKT